MSEDSEYEPGRRSPTLAPELGCERGRDTDVVRTHYQAMAIGAPERVRYAGLGTECENILLER
jgi:hypothetical protein